MKITSNHNFTFPVLLIPDFPFTLDSDSQITGVIPATGA